MKDWKIERIEDRPFRVILWHLCEGKHWASKNWQGWYCNICNQKPPREIEFAADLADCEPLYSADYEDYKLKKNWRKQ